MAQSVDECGEPLDGFSDSSSVDLSERRSLQPGETAEFTVKLEPVSYPIFLVAAQGQVDVTPDETDF